MSLHAHTSGDTTVMSKLITRRLGGRVIELGIAFRTADAPLGYLPFFDVHDFDYNGRVSFREHVLARLPINVSAAGSPHTELLREAAGDPEFTGAGSEDLVNIQREVSNDQLRYAMRSAQGVFVDGLMLAIGGPAIKTVVGSLVKSKLRQFILSKTISAAAKRCLKEQGGFDADKFLSGVP